MNKITALHAILEDCLALPAGLTRKNVEDMVTWIKGLQCYTLTISSLAEAVAAIDTIHS